MIAIVNYGMGNLGSVKNAFDFIGVDSYVANSPKEIEKADAIVLPGVGSFGKAMQNLSEFNMKDSVKMHIENKKPFLGICLGLQMLFEKSSESPSVEGLSVIKGGIEKFNDDIQLKIPQIGWNNILTKKTMPVLGNFNNEYMYFVHSYCASLDNKEISAITEYGIEFCSAVEFENILACQFHPEKSGKVGLELLKKWMEVYL